MKSTRTHQVTGVALGLLSIAGCADDGNADSLISGTSPGTGDEPSTGEGDSPIEENPLELPPDNSGTAGSASAGGTPATASVCGDGRIEQPENCDDGNTTAGDGCSAECETEAGSACPTPGAACVMLAVCGDGSLGVGEECDDTNTDSGDGCTDRCFVELGWECPTAGSRCVALACGDGIVAGNEQCDDAQSPPADGDGCSSACRLEPGYHCPTVGEACQATVCGNGVAEGNEPCDDGNGDVGDGCTPLCEREPTCVDGACTSTCGDGMILPGDGEGCDDGNLINDDGCSSTCVQEEGYTCDLETEDPPDELVLPIAVRDFLSTGYWHDDLAIEERANYTEHPDFRTYSGDRVTPGLVANELSGGKPVYTGICSEPVVIPDPDASNCDPDFLPCPCGQLMSSEENFNQWYNDSPGSIRLNSTLTLVRNNAGQYVYDSQDHGGFHPEPLFSAESWYGQGIERISGQGQAYGFTTELRYWFELEGGEELSFRGDDDVWVFINNQLLIDLGGLHTPMEDSITLTNELIDDLGMEVGGIYEVVLFHAERAPRGSNFLLTLNGFTKTLTSCEATCGDGIVAGDEVCDDGNLGGQYGYCKTDCSGLAERCGDAVVQEEEGEVCDDGTTLTGYDFFDSGGCAPGCQIAARCGDNHVDIAFGEQCDDGNRIDDDGCESNCTYRAECGDGVVDEADGETCDDGNRDNGDGCSQFCTYEPDIPR